jgi:uncharacterized protein (DUF1015 family)
VAAIKPFRGLRPRRELAQKIACPPYDVVSTEEARACAAGNPYCFFHVSRPEVGPLHGDEYETAAYNLQRFCEQRWLERDDSPKFYIYRQKMRRHEQTGVVAATSTDEYERGLIKKHELTRPDKEDDRTRHIAALDANDEPVFLTYRASRKIDPLVDELTRAAPEYDFAARDGVVHTFWVAPPDKSGEIEHAFNEIPALYIADGHHRIAAASRVRKMLGASADHFLAVIFPHDQVRILSYNRLVRDLNGFNRDEILRRLSAGFDVERTTRKEPALSGQFSMYLDHNWYALRAHTQDELDVTTLQENVLAPIFGIADPRTDSRVQFVGGIRGTDELEQRVDSGEYGAAFSLFPTRLEQLFAIADRGGVMPPKSTWFEPKLRSGLIVHPYE